MHQDDDGAVTLRIAHVSDTKAYQWLGSMKAESMNALRLCLDTSHMTHLHSVVLICGEQQTLRVQQASAAPVLLRFKAVPLKPQYGVHRRSRKQQLDCILGGRREATQNILYRLSVYRHVFTEYRCT